MFLCDECHPKLNDGRTGGLHSKSYGTCEGCNRTALCVDCGCAKKRDPENTYNDTNRGT